MSPTIEPLVTFDQALVRFWPRTTWLEDELKLKVVLRTKWNAECILERPDCVDESSFRDGRSVERARAWFATVARATFLRYKERQEEIALKRLIDMTARTSILYEKEWETYSELLKRSEESFTKDMKMFQTSYDSRAATLQSLTIDP